MPTYDYRCRDCGHTIEIIHSILEDGPEVCERCRGPMQRVLHPAGVIFRGSGFYVTDSRSSKAKAGESAGGSGASTGGSAKDSSSGSAKDSSSGSAKDSSSGSGGTPAAGSDSGGSGKD